MVKTIILCEKGRWLARILRQRAQRHDMQTRSGGIDGNSERRNIKRREWNLRLINPLPVNRCRGHWKMYACTSRRVQWHSQTSPGNFTTMRMCAWNVFFSRLCRVKGESLSGGWSPHMDYHDGPSTQDSMMLLIMLSIFAGNLQFCYNLISGGDFIGTLSIFLIWIWFLCCGRRFSARWWV